MKHSLIRGIFGCLFTIATAHAQPGAEGSRPLFNGRDLTGWEGNPALWSVEEGCNILSIHLRPDGASYQAESEDFVTGAPLPVTDAVIGPDGAMYSTIGGRGTQSALMRVTYTGGESTAAAVPAALPKEALTRHELEAFHGVLNPKAVEAAWPHLASADRFLRNAARVAIESQPVATWAETVFTEKNTQARITAAVAPARSGTPDHRERLLKHLLALDFKSLPTMQKLGVLRAISLTLDRLGKETIARKKK